MKSIEQIAKEQYPASNIEFSAFVAGTNYVKAKTDNAFCMGHCGYKPCPGQMSCNYLETFRKVINDML